MAGKPKSKSGAGIKPKSGAGIKPKSSGSGLDPVGK